MSAKTLMIQGTASNVGKSILVTAFCRIFKRRGYRVAPFKAQNMSNNSFVTTGGGEIGRAQVSQARAAGTEPCVEMNPVLLKPSSDKKAQVVVMGKITRTMSAREYDRYKRELIPVVDAALKKLTRDFDVVVIEGAGSPAEINMKKNDIVNMRVAKSVSSPVILVGDIDKGGVFAQMVGTFELLEPEEKELVAGFIINKFRGDKGILASGVRWIEQRIQRKCLGVLPFIPDLNIEQEDSVVLDESRAGENAMRGHPQKLLIGVIRLPRISNFTDFEALGREPDVILRYMDSPDRHCLPDLIVIPGTKSTIEDLKFLKQSGLADYIKRCARAGVAVIGICGGYQMLGQRIEDPEHIESRQASCEGLGLLPAVTTFHRDKKTVQVKAVHLESQLEVKGYEIHMGQTRNLNGAVPAFKITRRQGESVEDYDGFSICQNADSEYPSYILGTYIHGLFDSPGFRRYFLNKIRHSAGLKAWEAKQEPEEEGAVYDRLADEVESNIDMRFLEEIFMKEYV